MKFASRISRISVSQTMAVNEKALQMRAQGVDIVDFGAGEPDFPTPENIKQAGIRAIECNFTRYTPIGGTPDLRKAIVEQHARDFRIEFSTIRNASSMSAASTRSSTRSRRSWTMVMTSSFPRRTGFRLPISRATPEDERFSRTRSEAEGFRLTAELSGEISHSEDASC